MNKISYYKDLSITDGEFIGVVIRLQIGILEAKIAVG
jgi:hypothetical protein